MTDEPLKAKWWRKKRSVADMWSTVEVGSWLVLNDRS